MAKKTYSDPSDPILQKIADELTLIRKLMFESAVQSGRFDREALLKTIEEDSDESKKK